jgi:hypothetical protein
VNLTLRDNFPNRIDGLDLKTIMEPALAIENK